MSTVIPSLQQQLDDFAKVFAAKVPAEVRQVMDEAGEDVNAIFASQTHLDVGDQMPEFTLSDARGNTVAVADLLANGPLVVAFYRGGWCPYCNLELRALQAALPEFKVRGAELVAISPETPDASLSTEEKNELQFTVLSDVGAEVAEQFGLVFTLPESLRPVYEQFGIDVPAHNGDDTFQLPVPATYVIGTDGSIKYAFANPDYRQRAEPSQILAALG